MALSIRRAILSSLLALLSIDTSYCFGTEREGTVLLIYTNLASLSLPIVRRENVFSRTKVGLVNSQENPFMVNMFKAIATQLQKIASSFFQALNALQLQHIVAASFVGLLLLSTSVDTADLPASTKTMLNDMIARGEEGRPVTTGQWQAENEKLQGKPAKQVKRIAKESADAVGEMGEIYPGNAKTLTPGLENKSLERDD